MQQTAQIIQFDRGRMEHEEASAPDTGYIKLFRTLQDCSFAHRPEFVSAWVHFLLMASHKPHKTMIGNKPVQLGAGQFVSGRKALADIVGVSEKQMRGILDFFVGEGMLTRTSSRTGTVFTVCNYRDFQAEPGKNGGQAKASRGAGSSESGANKGPTQGQGGPTVLGQAKGQQKGQDEGQGKASNGGASSDIGANGKAKGRANERANEKPDERATKQENNISTSDEVDIDGSSGDEPTPRKPTPKPIPVDYPSEFEWIWEHRPRREGSDPKRKAYQACKARIKQGATWRELAEGMKRYRKFCEAKNILNTEFVKQMASFFGPDEHFRNDWAVNATTQPTRAGGPDFDDLSWREDLGGL